MDISKVVTTSSNRDFVRNKNVIVGTSRLVDGIIYLANGDKSIVSVNTSYVPSLFKILDEIIVNSVDHFINCILRLTIQHKCGYEKVDRFVRVIRVTISGDSFEVMNDGYGIPIVMVDKYKKYLPEVLFSEEKTGTNMGDDSTRITGGTNGTGATTICAFSKSIKLIIFDANKKYRQSGSVVTESGEDKFVFAPPTITKNGDPTSQVTCVSFEIDWRSTGYKSFTKTTKSLFINYIIKRLIQTALYTRHVTATAKSLGIITHTESPAIMYGDSHIDLDYNNEVAINKTFGLIKSFVVTLTAKKAPANKLSSAFTLIVGVNDVDKPGYKEISIINGVEVLRNPIADNVKIILTKAVKVYCENNKMPTANAKTKNYITIIMIGCIPDPQWIGQVKEGLTLNKDFISNYDIREKCDSIKDKLAKVVFEMVTNDKLKKKRSRAKDLLKGNELYTRCLSIEDGKRVNRNTKTYLFICEGSSANNLLTNIKDKNYMMNKDNAGSLVSKGVITNVYHKMNWYSNSDFEYIKVDSRGVKCRLISDEKVTENKFIQTFIDAMNLSEDKISDLELEKRLNYDYVVCATDSDYDGWNITGLLIVLVSKWECLLRNGRMKILHLPIIRIIPKDLETLTTKERRKNNGLLSDEFINSIQYWEFNTQLEYETFIKHNKVPNTHFIKYYKGLATTDAFFDYIIAKDMDKYIYTVLWDDNAAKNLESYYGKTRVDIVDGESVVVKMSDERKRLLSTPVRRMSTNERKLYELKCIAVTTFLEIFVKQYFLDNVHRKLLKIVDGKNNVGTKLTYSYPTVFRGKDARFLKVSEVGPDIGKITQYHHGEAAINKAIQNAGQQYPGAVMFPILITSGKWGTRHDGGDGGMGCSLGAPRYITCKLNSEFYKLLYPADDKIVLDYQEDEGRPTEPKYLLPVFPTIALENYATTAHGWKITMWARSYISIAGYILKLITVNLSTNAGVVARVKKEIEEYMFPIELRNYDVEPTRYCSFDNGYEEFFLSKGRYNIVKRDGLPDRIMVTSLPIGVWTVNYIKYIENKIGTKEKQGSLYGIVKSIEPFSNEMVNICITMYDGWENKIVPLVGQDKSWFHDDLDNIEVVLHLYAKISDEINVIDENGAVKSFTKYTDLVQHWFNVRVSYYVKRVARLIKLTELELLHNEQKVNYLSRFSELGLSGMPSEEFNSKLESEGFLKFRSSTNSIKYNLVPNDKLIKFHTEDFDPEDDDNVLLAELISSGVFDGYARSYSYLKTLSTGSTSAKGIDKARAKSAELRAKIESLKVDKIEYRLFKDELMQLNRYVTAEFYGVS